MTDELLDARLACIEAGIEVLITRADREDAERDLAQAQADARADWLAIPWHRRILDRLADRCVPSSALTAWSNR